MQPVAVSHFLVTFTGCVCWGFGLAVLAVNGLVGMDTWLDEGQ